MHLENKPFPGIFIPRASVVLGITRALIIAALLTISAVCLAPAANAALLDVWRANDLNFDNGDLVTTWASASNRVAGAVNAAEQPIFVREATPGGSHAVRFTGDRLQVSDSPVGGRTTFSIALVFRASSPGAGDNVQWYGKSGLVDAEGPNIRPDWGTVLTEAGQIGIGIGGADVSLYSTGASLVGTNYHAAVFTWGGGSQSVFVDDRAPVTQAGSSTSARENIGFTIGGIHTGEANRRLNGDIVEIRFYDTALTSMQASNVIWELNDTHIAADRPRVLHFSASTNEIMIGQSVTLSWDVTNAVSVTLDNGIGSVAAKGSLQVAPTNTTTYTLVATNNLGSRTAMVTIQVDQGIPVADPIHTNMVQNTALSLVLRATDPNGGMLTYRIVDAPIHGTLSGTPPNVTYTPTTDYLGLDAFTFVASDGVFDSTETTVSIQVGPPPAPPTGIAISSTNISTKAGPGSYLALLRAIDPNMEDTHSFTLVPAFGENAQFLVQGNQLYAGATFANGAGAVFNIRLRATDNTGLSVEQMFRLIANDIAQSVVINEIHYNGAQNTIRDEFVELYNPTDTAIDVSQWRLRGGVDFYLPNGTILNPGQFLVIAENPQVLASWYGATALGPWAGSLNNEGEEVTLLDSQGRAMDRVDYNVEFPWPISPDGEGASMQLVNPALDNDLGSSWRGVFPPTPGAVNASYSTNAAPNIRQVNHTPNQPRSTNQVIITAKVTDPEGVASVQLHYQVLAPGSFIPATLPLASTRLNGVTDRTTLTNAPNLAFEASTNWATVAMNDDGQNGDEIAGDAIYTVVLPQQAHRTLVRYRITVTDALGASRRAPFEDDPSLNFAYFVYNGVPAYKTFGPEILQTLPVYTLITRKADLDQCTAWLNSADQLQQNVSSTVRNEGRLHFNWEGAIVYDGVVYDHITYRLRGANGRYHPGKRSFRFQFNPGHYLDARDQEGKRFPTKWRELTTGKGQSNRGSETFALNEVVNMFLWNKVGVPAPLTFHFHFRVIRGANEAPNDFEGDFFGLTWGQEKYDVNFLEAHDLPRGNLYKLVDNFFLGVNERRYQGPYAVTNAEDFWNIENNLTGFKSTDWLLAHANYTNWYRYFAIAEAIRHYDTWPSANKNGAWYFEPIYTAANGYLGRMMQLPYDSTDTWGPTWNNGEDILFNGIFPSTATGGDTGQNPEMQIQYRNIVREIRDLLFQPDQLMPIIDTFANRLKPFSPADLARWANAPAPASYASMANPGPGLNGGVAGYAEDMKKFMFVGGNNAWWIDRTSVGGGGWVTRLDQVAADSAIPNQPAATYAGTNGFPLDGLVFSSSAFSDPQGSNTFAAMQWRVAEVTLTNQLPEHPTQLKLEWDALWDSGELTTFNEFISVPATVVQADHLYRVRVRHKDSTGRWSRWSPAVEFRPGPADVVSALRANLVFSEIMYNPPGQGAVDGDEFEFLELKNIGTATLDLSGLVFTSGINYSFPNGTRLAPGGLFLLARNPTVLRTRYTNVVVNGIYTGRLNNDGETVALSHPHAGVILSLTYGDRAPWPVAANGFGFSLVLKDAVARTYGPSATVFGSPGTDAPASTLGGVVINEVLSSSTLPLRDMIELFNISSNPVDISGWRITDDPNYPWKYRIPAGTVLASGAFYVVDETAFNPTPGVGSSFSLSSMGDDVYVFSADQAGLTGYSQGFSFGAAQDGVSYGRYLNSVGDEQFVAQVERTLDNGGTANAGPRFGPVVITEINYHPLNLTDEFVELKNLTASDIPLFDPAASTNRWRLNGLGYTFAPNVTLPANGYLLLVHDDPAAFRARHVVPDSVPVLPFTATLQDGGENLELQAPDAPTTNGTPFYALDVVRYNDRAPWPVAADGAGASLHRLNQNAYGNDPINWRAALPTPGRGTGTGTPPTIVNQSGNQGGVVSGNATLFVTAAGSEPMFYQWRFNGSNLGGATNAILTLNGLGLDSAGVYSAVIYNSAGSAESTNITVGVRMGATIITQPQPVTVRIRPDPFAAPVTNATFTIAAQTFNPPMSYQWQFEGHDIPGATNATLLITNVQVEHEGDYRAAITDRVGTVHSEPARLIPFIAPKFVVNPTSQTVPVGQPFTLSAEATGNPLPFAWEWRRGSTVIGTFTNYERSSFFTFVATNIPATTTYRAIVRALTTSVASGNATIVTVADADNDGLPDDWESRFGLNPASEADRNQDSDNDGLTNWQEYTADTDPTNNLSYLRVELATPLNATPTVVFPGASNRTYTVQFSDHLGRPWSKLADVIARTNDFTATIADPSYTTNRFYRLVTPRQP